MFDTKIYHQFGCGCLECHPVGCRCDYHISHVFHKPLCQQVVEQQIYNKGYYEGRRDAYAELEREKRQFKDATEEKRFAELLNDAMKPLEDLRNELL